MHVLGGIASFQHSKFFGNVPGSVVKFGGNVPGYAWEEVGYVPIRFERYIRVTVGVPLLSSKSEIN